MVKLSAPTLNVNDDNLKILNIFAKDGDLVKAGDLLVEIESSKTTEDVLAPIEGIVKFEVGEGDVVAPGSVLAYLFETQEKYDKYCGQLNPSGEGKTGLLATEKAIALAKEAGIDISKIKPAGKIVKESDVRRYLKEKNQAGSLDEFSFPDKGFVDIEALKKEVEEFKRQTSSGQISLDLYRSLGAKIGKNVFIGRGSYILARQIVIEDDVVIGDNVEIIAKRLFIGRMALIGDGVSIKIRDFYLGDVSLIGDKSLLGGGDRFGPDAGIYISERCFVGRESILDAGDGIIMREHSCLSPRVCVYTHSHWQDYLKGYNPSFGRVEIGEDAHIGGGALIAPGVSIGKGTFVMANSLVASDIGENEVWGGVPAEKKGDVKRIEYLRIKKERFAALYKKMIGYLEKVGIDINKVHYSPELSDSELTPEKVFLCFECDFDIDENALLDREIALFDLQRYEFYGKQNEISDAVRNFLRRYGIKFEPIYWRPSPKMPF